jgi:N-ethylmaleimide reductase
MTSLFSSFQLGRLQLPNRVVMSPMTRSRAVGNVPNDLMATYYSQRAAAGLLITEGTAPSPNGLGYARIPGIYSPEQIAGWRLVSDAVHAAGGRIFVQIMHTGRVSHAHNLPSGARVLAPSALAAPGQMHTDAAGMQPHPVPDAMTETEIAAAIAEFTHASRSAIAAGLDGVELHGANGYLIEQFLNVGANQRTDGYGSQSIASRARFALEVVRASVDAIGADRVGIRLSPHGGLQGTVADPETDALYVHLATELSRLGIAYLHVVDHTSMGATPPPDALKAALRAAFKGAYILSGGYDLARAEADLAAGKGDLVAFGRPFIANPGLVDKLKTGAELRAPDPNLLFTPGAQGYSDWPRD